MAEKEGSYSYIYVPIEERRPKANTFFSLVSDEETSITTFVKLCTNQQTTLAELEYETERRLDEFFKHYNPAEKSLFDEMFSLLKKAESKDELQLYYQAFLLEINKKINASYQHDSKLSAKEIVSKQIKLTYALQCYQQKLLLNPTLLTLDEKSKQEMLEVFKVGVMAVVPVAGMFLGLPAELAATSARQGYNAYHLATQGDQKESYFNRFKKNVSDSWNWVKTKTNNLLDWMGENTFKTLVGGLLFVAALALSVVLLPVTLVALAGNSAINTGRLINFAHNSNKDTDAGMARVDRFVTLVDKLHQPPAVDEHDAHVALMNARGLNLVNEKSSTVVMIKQGGFTAEGSSPLTMQEEKQESKQAPLDKFQKEEEKLARRPVIHINVKPRHT